MFNPMSLNNPQFSISQYNRLGQAVENISRSAGPDAVRSGGNMLSRLTPKQILTVFYEIKTNEGEGKYTIAELVYKPEGKDYKLFSARNSYTFTAYSIDNSCAYQEGDIVFGTEMVSNLGYVYFIIWPKYDMFFGNVTTNNEDGSYEIEEVYWDKDFDMFASSTNARTGTAYEIHYNDSISEETNILVFVLPSGKWIFDNQWPTPEEGDLLVGNDSGGWDLLKKGASKTTLQVNGAGDVDWRACNLLDAVAHNDTKTATPVENALIVGKAGGEDADYWGKMDLPTMTGDLLTMNSDGVLEWYQYVEWGDDDGDMLYWDSGKEQYVSATVGTENFQVFYWDNSDKRLTPVKNPSGDGKHILRIDCEASTLSAPTWSKQYLLDSDSHDDTASANASIGAIVVGKDIGGTPKWGKLTVGNDGKILKCNASIDSGLEWANGVPDGLNSGDMLIWNTTLSQWKLLSIPTNPSVLVCDSTSGVRWLGISSNNGVFNINDVMTSTLQPWVVG